MQNGLQNLILKQLDEIKKSAEKDRELLFQQLRKVDEDVDELRLQIIHLENEAKNTRWFFAGAGAFVAIVLRELLPRLF